MMKRSSQFDRDYFEYLCSKTGTKPGYEEVLKNLHLWDFEPLIPNDDNRCSDGLAIRAEYGFVENIFPFINGPCTVLEMLIGLSERIAFIVDVFPDLKGPFWELIKNLRLQPGQPASNDTRINVFVNRAYRADGKGGLFPLRHPQKDQRQVEVWYQMMSYLEENYF